MLVQKFQDFIEENNLFTKKDHLLLAVSGGVDSVVLCELCRQAGYFFSIAHANFQLREEESERDEEFVKGLADLYQSQVFIKKFDTSLYATEKKISIQLAARELRYDWFNTIPVNLEMPDSFFKIVTAHHADDNVETLLMNFFRGTGIRGLGGILPRQGNIIRPLLKFRKEELLAFARQEHLNWVEDSSNSQEKYSRNYFRNSFIPFVKKVYPNAEDNLLDNIERFREIEILYRQAIEKQKKQLLTLKEDEIHIPVLKLKKSVPLNTLIYEILKPYHFSSQQVNEVVHLLNSEQGKYVQSPTHRVIKNRNWIIISPNQSASSPFIILEHVDQIAEFANGSIRCEIFPTADFKIPVSRDSACLDASSIEFPLILRKWKQGDYFYPLGMKKKKKLSRFLIDLKCSPTEKEKTWVLEMRRKIIWVVNLRIDERFRITDRTKKILKISFSA